jgi:putative toxin-antitoxin system antitoxin component (TIGR02293 family)
MTPILAQPPTAAAAVLAVKKGLAWSEATFLAEKLALTLDELATCLGIPASTFFRRKGRRFTTNESDHLMRFANLWDVARHTFDSEAGAAKWLKTPQVGLGGAVPLDYAQTEIGAREVEALLKRIEYDIA